MQLTPFSDSIALSSWAAENLGLRGIDEVSEWRMLEYWFQVEIFRLAQSRKAGSWRHMGNYEQPYHTELPRSGSKTKTKWIDLVLASPVPEAPEAIVWVELKDIGRSKATMTNNAKGLGHDLAALWALNPEKTKQLWLSPQPHSIDRGRFDEWNKYGPGLNGALHLIAQIVIGPKAIDGGTTPDEIAHTWSAAFLQRVRNFAPAHAPCISRNETEKFHVFGLVAELPKITANNAIEPTR